MSYERTISSLWKLFSRPIFFIVLGAVLLSAVSFLGAPMGNDEGVWAYIGRIWAEHGLLPYTGAIENKGTVIYMVFGLSQLLFGTNVWFPRVLAAIAVLGTGALLFALGKRLGNRRAALIAMAMFILTMPLQSVDGSYAETESFMNFFRVLTFLLTLLAYEKSRYRTSLLALSGISFGFAIASKQLAVIDVIPLIALHFFLAQKNVQTAFRALLITAAGTIGGNVLSLIPYLLSGGTFASYIDGAWMILLQSGSSPHSVVSRASGFFRHFFNPRLAFLSMGLIGFLLLRKRLAQTTALYLPLLVWALTDFAAYNADGWYLDHHYKVFIPSWALLFGIVVDYLLRQLAGEEKERKAFVVGMSMLMLFYIPFESNYFQNVRKFLKGTVYDYSAQDLGLYIKEKTNPGDFVYIWGFHMGVQYYYSDRVSPSRYFSEPFLGRPGALGEIKSDLEKNKPALIAVPVEKFPVPEWFQEHLDAGYRFSEEKFGYKIFLPV